MDIFAYNREKLEPAPILISFNKGLIKYIRYICTVNNHFAVR